MKAIQTKFHGPGNVRGSRYSATDCDGNKITISADHSLNSDKNHRAAAIALCRKMGWSGTLAQGGLGNTEVFVFTDYEGDVFKVVDTQPKTGEVCHCRPGVHRDNCPDCEGTGLRIDFKAIRRSA